MGRMGSIVLLLGLLAVLLGSTPGVEALKCWSCSSQVNAKCAEDSISGDESIILQKQDCTQIFRNQQVSCTKTVTKHADRIDVSRGCAPRGVASVEDGKCNHIPQSDGSHVTCNCGSDLCNGAESVRLVPALGFVIVMGRVLGKMMAGHF